MERERKRIGWSLQNTWSSSPSLAKCCLQQFGPHHQFAFQPHHCLTPLRDLNYFSYNSWYHCVSKNYSLSPSPGFAPPSACAEKPCDFCCPLQPAHRCPPAHLTPASTAFTLGTASWAQFQRQEIRVRCVGGCF